MVWRVRVESFGNAEGGGAELLDAFDEMKREECIPLQSRARMVRSRSESEKASRKARSAAPNTSTLHAMRRRGDFQSLNNDHSSMTVGTAGWFGRILGGGRKSKET